MTKRYRGSFTIREDQRTVFDRSVMRRRFRKAEMLSGSSPTSRSRITSSRIAWKSKESQTGDHMLSKGSQFLNKQQRSAVIKKAMTTQLEHVPYKG